MNTYFFHLIDGRGDVYDQHGLAQPDLEACRRRAVANAREIIAHDVCDGVIDLRMAICVENAEGMRVLHVPFADAVEVKR